MAVNPAEDIVNVWLQENYRFFTRQNINVRKRTRVVNGKKVGGGRGKEIDILGMDISGKKIWVEVTVSPHPYLAKKEEQVNKMVEKVEKAFDKEKVDEVRRIFGTNKFHKMFVYSKRVFSGETDKKEKQFSERIKGLGVEAIEFEKVLNETIENLNYYSVDPTRIFLYYAKSYLQPKSTSKR